MHYDLWFRLLNDKKTLDVFIIFCFVLIFLLQCYDVKNDVYLSLAFIGNHMINLLFSELGFKKSLLNAFHDGCHHNMAMVINDRLKV